MASASGVRMRTTNGRGFILDTEGRILINLEAAGFLPCREIGPDKLATQNKVRGVIQFRRHLLPDNCR
jgi:hypothetical protein